MRARIYISIVVILIAHLLPAVTITIVNKDAAGVGFNDTTPAAPVGGNPGRTLGAQRLNVFNAAAAIWGAKLQSNIPIKITAQFGPLSCTDTSGTLGAAGPTDAFKNFPNAPKADTWYPVALASALSGTDYGALYETDGASINASFNGNLGNPGCLSGLHWYLGLDNNHGTDMDLETVVLHEFGHGLGFLTFENLDTGALPGGFPDTFLRYIFDNTTSQHWDVMTNAQRLTSSTNASNVVFDGTNVAAGAGILSAGKDGSGHPKLYTPSSAVPGSSVSHYDKSATPNQLMEPVASSDLTHSVDLPQDLTMKAMLDIGWQAACAGTITLSPATLPNGTTGTAYAQTITASGGTAAYTYAVTAGALPAGLTLSAAGSLSGTPTATATFTPTITATDANGCTGSRVYSITISCPTITVSPATLPNGTSGTAYNQTITASGGTAAYTFAVTAGALPTGLTLSTGGALSGTPTQTGTFTPTITATGANGCTGSRAYSFTIGAGCGAITVSPATLPNGTSGTAYNQTITASGGTGAYTFALTAGALPTGLTLSAGGALSGTPTQTGTFTPTIRATDAVGCTGSRAYSFTIGAGCPTITLSPAALPAATSGVAYSQTITASGGTGAYSYTKTGTLPTGVTLSTAGLLSGTPTQTGTFNVTVTATDAASCTGSKAYSLVVVAPGSIVAGDANHDGVVDAGDVYYLINYLFAGGPAPH